MKQEEKGAVEIVEGDDGFYATVELEGDDARILGPFETYDEAGEAAVRYAQHT